MNITLSNILTRCYWPVVVVYCIILLLFVLLYFTEINHWSNREYYHWMNLKRIIIPGVFLMVSLILKNQGNQKMANIILYIPVAFTLLILVGSLLMLMLFMINTK